MCSHPQCRAGINACRPTTGVRQTPQLLPGSRITKVTTHGATTYVVGVHVDQDGKPLAADELDHDDGTTA